MPRFSLTEAVEIPQTEAKIYSCVYKQLPLLFMSVRIKQGESKAAVSHRTATSERQLQSATAEQNACDF